MGGRLNLSKPDALPPVIGRESHGRDRRLAKAPPAPRCKRREFERRLRQRYYDPAFGPLTSDIEFVAVALAEAYRDSRQIAGFTRRAGAKSADPD